MGFRRSEWAEPRRNLPPVVIDGDKARSSKLLSRPVVKTEGGKGWKYNVFFRSMWLLCYFPPFPRHPGRDMFYSSLKIQKAPGMAHSGCSIFVKLKAYPNQKQVFCTLPQFSFSKSLSLGDWPIAKPEQLIERPYQRFTLSTIHTVASALSSVSSWNLEGNINPFVLAFIRPHWQRPWAQHLLQFVDISITMGLAAFHLPHPFHHFHFGPGVLFLNMHLTASSPC